ncbi:MAG: hypothetical protein RIQ52_97 [Pseudomonadota bacterium]|jgi:putative IMPACT (imprinted ancient) family translation regulator
MSDQETLAEAVVWHEKIRESDFFAHGQRADTPEDALAFIRSLLPGYPGVSHICWAYRIGGQHRCSDDGEPGGTGGPPILRAIEGQKLDHVVVAVARYFGGVKLGAGGLMRAYGGTAAQLLRTAPRVMMVMRRNVLVEVPFDLTASLYHHLSKLDAVNREEHFTEHGLCVRLSLPETDIRTLANGLGYRAVLTYPDV